MKTERQIVEKIVELAKESARQSEQLKLEADRPVADTPKAIEEHNEKLRLMERAQSQTAYALLVLTGLFE